MTSPARAAANAANAQLSTGPSTAEGKARSSRNAVKHGLTSKQLVIAPAEEDEFAELHDSLLEQLAPEGALEMGIFNMLVHAAWQIQLSTFAEAAPARSRPARSWPALVAAAGPSRRAAASVS